MSNQIIMANIFGPSELIVIFLVILFFFGGKRLPGLAKDLGSGIRTFKKAMEGELEKEEEDEKKEPESKSKTISKKKMKKN